jgi:hypothetical protein
MPDFMFRVMSSCPSRLEKEFTLKEGVTFINHGGYGAVPRRVQEAQKR